MADYNRVIMIGNLTRDPEYKTLTSGQAVCRLGLASNRQFRNKQTSTMVQEVCYIDIDVWGAQAESCRQYLQKGRAVLIEGRLKFDTWEDPNGQTRSKHIVVADRVVFLAQTASEGAENVSVSQNVGTAQRDPNAQLEKELLDQIEKIKSRTTAKNENIKHTPSKAPKSSTSANAMETKPAGQEAQTVDSMQYDGVDFKDEPPFQDDLPF